MFKESLCTYLFYYILKYPLCLGNIIRGERLRWEDFIQKIITVFSNHAGQRKNYRGRYYFMLFENTAYLQYLQLSCIYFGLASWRFYSKESVLIYLWGSSSLYWGLLYWYPWSTGAGAGCGKGAGAGCGSETGTNGGVTITASSVKPTSRPDGTKLWPICWGDR